MPRGLSRTSFTPRMREVLRQVMRDAWSREKGRPVSERRMRFNPVPKLSDLKDLIGAHTLSVRNGVYTARKGYFYTHGGTAEKFAARIKEALPTSVILDLGDEWKPFRGGASVAQQSHWWVTFRIS